MTIGSPAGGGRAIAAIHGRAPPQSYALLVLVGLLVALLVTGFSLADRFGTWRNLVNVFEQSVSLGLVALGQTVVILTGGIDLSIGALMSASAMLTSGLIDGEAARVVPVCLGVLVFGAAVGTANGALTHALRIHPLIVTLGMAAVLQGGCLLYSRGPIGSVPLGFDIVAFGRVADVPIGGALMLALFLAMGIFLRFSRTGRRIYAFGGDPVSARLLGISSLRVLMVSYGLSGALAALAGMYIVSRAGVGEPWAGQGFDLASVTPVVVGGTILAGGRGGVTGTLLGVCLVALMSNLLNFLNVSTYYQWIVQGLIVLAAVSLNAERRRRA